MHLLDSISTWLKAPFQSNQSAYKWVLFVGLLIVASLMWHMILLYIVGEVKEVA